MSTMNNPEAGNLGAEVEDAGSEIDVSMLARLSEHEAARLTSKIQLRLGMIADSIEQVVPLIQRAHDTRAHEVLGYRSWGEYVADKFGGALGRLTKAQRLPVVELLASQGMSTSARLVLVTAPAIDETSSRCRQVTHVDFTDPDLDWEPINALQRTWHLHCAGCQVCLTILMHEGGELEFCETCRTHPKRPKPARSGWDAVWETDV